MPGEACLLGCNWQARVTARPGLRLSAPVCARLALFPRLGIRPASDNMPQVRLRGNGQIYFKVDKLLFVMILVAIQYNQPLMAFSAVRAFDSSLGRSTYLTRPHSN